MPFLKELYSSIIIRCILRHHQVCGDRRHTFWVSFTLAIYFLHMISNVFIQMFCHLWLRFLCFFRPSAVAHMFLQMSHWKVFSLHLCFLKSFTLLDWWPHTSHLNLYPALWTRVCFLKFSLLLVVKSHNVHSSLGSSLCTESMCLYRCEMLWQRSHSSTSVCVSWSLLMWFFRFL